MEITEETLQRIAPDGRSLPWAEVGRVGCLRPKRNLDGAREALPDTSRDSPRTLRQGMLAVDTNILARVPKADDCRASK